MRTIAAAILIVISSGCNIAASDARQTEDAEILVTYHCKAGHAHREVVEARPDSRGVLMPTTDAGKQIECLLPGTESEVTP